MNQPKQSHQLELKVPQIDFKQIHPMVIAMQERKATKAKVSLYFHDVNSWLKSVLLSLNSHRDLQKKRQDKDFVDALNADSYKQYEYIEELTFFLENAVTRLSAVRDKLALTAFIYYRHPAHLGKTSFVVKGCLKCGNKDFEEKITEKNCNFGLLLRYLEQERVSDDLSILLREIASDKDINWIVNQRNTISHRMSEYRWIGLGIFPKSFEVKYEGDQEVASWVLGSPKHIFLDEINKIEQSYNNFVTYIEKSFPIFFPTQTYG